MTTTINADNTTGGLIVSNDGSGVLGLQSSGVTVLTLNTTQALGVGASPDYGTTGQVLTSQGPSAAPVWAMAASGAQGFVTQSTGVNAAPGAFLPNDSIALI